MNLRDLANLVKLTRAECRASADNLIRIRLCVLSISSREDVTQRFSDHVEELHGFGAWLKDPKVVRLHELFQSKVELRGRPRRR